MNSKFQSYIEMNSSLKKKKMSSFLFHHAFSLRNSLLLLFTISHFSLFSLFSLFLTPSFKTTTYRLRETGKRLVAAAPSGMDKSKKKYIDIAI